METDTKQKVIKGMAWTGAERLGTQVIQFIIGIIIARVLYPSDYGLIGMLAIFMGIAQTFIDSGFANALIQKKDRNQKDYSTVFFFSIGIGCLMYIILFLCAPFIADFYNEPVLISITRIYMLTLVINSFSISQTAKLTVDLNFRAQAITSIISVSLSGIIGVLLAYKGFGVWALIWQGISSSCLRTAMLWIVSRWKPLIVFSKESFNKLFSFGSKLLVSSLINNIYSNISTLIIGKAFHATDLGFFTRAQQFCVLPTNTITNIVLKVNYPILSQIQEDDKKLIGMYATLLRTPIYILYPLLFGLAILSKPLIIVLLGNKWVESSTLIPILCFGYLWEPLTHINLNLLYVKGKTNLVLKLECIKKPLAFIMLFLSIPFGLKVLCASLALYNFIAFCFNCYYTGKLLNYGFIQQIYSIIPIIIYSILMIVVIGICIHPFTDPLLKLIVGIIVGIITYFGVSFIFKDRSLLQLFSIIKR